MKFINYLRWLITRKSVEESLLRYCTLEYKGNDVYAAYNEAVRDYKSRVINGANYV